MLEVRQVTCVRGDRPLFSGADFRLEDGEALYVSGPNGAGKTSLLRLLCGLAAPAEGEICWGGEPIRRLSEDFYSELLYLGHAAALKDDLTAGENLRTAAEISGRRLSRADAASALQRMGLKGREDLPARALSQGQRRRVNLARLLLPNAPKLWVLDEPFTALDVRAVAQLRDIVASHVKGGGIAVFTTHQDVQFPDITLRHAAIDAGKVHLC